MQKKLHQLIEDYKILSEKMTDLNIINNVAEYTRLAKEHRKLAPVINKSEEYLKLLKESDDNKELLLSEDIELKELAKEDLLFIQGKIKNLEDELKILLLPKDPNDDKNTILEIRSGTGGNEAALFAEDLYRMYLRYAELQKWKYEVISLNDNEGGGIKEVIVSILGQNVFGNLKYESGVHRVQRIPETESSGRIHTSAATVAVLPEAEEVDIQINDNDIKIDTYRASGAGGQHVNKTESAIRITHLPTNLVVTCQDESSQHKNRDKAMKVLRSRLLEHKTEKANKERSTARKKMVSTGDRSAKIRTYNFPQGRVTDHRINLTLYKLEEIMNGDIDEVINSLKNEDQKLQLEQINK